MSRQTAAAKRYHHGDLRNALLAEAERILEADGLPALTLRAVARAAAVTHAAPANHFGDLTGLLSELAADGHRRMNAAIATEVAAAGPGARTRAMGCGYVNFAKTHPGLFTLMFRGEKLDPERPSLKDAMNQSRQALRDVLTSRHGGDALPPIVLAAQATALWALVHGYATLLLEGRLQAPLARLSGETPESLFERVLDAVKLSQ